MSLVPLTLNVSSLEMQTDFHLVLQTLFELVLRQRQPLLQDRNRLEEEEKAGEEEEDRGRRCVREHVRGCTASA